MLSGRETQYQNGSMEKQNYYKQQQEPKQTKTTVHVIHLYR